ncbi:hypothetical protein MKX01_012686 [Papaver californicum]|nr:hypothetical protein MKX01_012686 [Papaver californicum]
MDKTCEEILSPSRPKWRKVAYGGMQPGYDDNYTDESFLEVCVWTYTLESNISEASLLILDEYKFEINGPWDEAKLCFDITE